VEVGGERKLLNDLHRVNNVKPKIYTEVYFRLDY